MGKHRKDRRFTRRQPTREPYDYILIICEGSKSEPNYLFGLRRSYNLSSINIEVTSAAGSDPLNIVDYGIEACSKDYDKVFCVFDHDGRPRFDEAVAKVKNTQKKHKGKLKVITSTPCFEFWILLHFAYTTAVFNKSGEKSACDNVVKAIIKHFPEYAKEHPTLFDSLNHKLEQAITHAKRLKKHNADAGSSNPATDLHELVDYLRKLKS